VEGTLSFAKVIEDHLELKRRNADLDRDMPLDHYKTQDPFENHPLFKSEEQARHEETLTGTEPMAMDDELVLAWPAQETKAAEGVEPVEEDTLWGRSRDFDWGD